MKIGLLGSGKTGGHILSLHPEKDIIVFNSKKLPNLKDLSSCDVLVSFLPADALSEYTSLIIESKTPLVSGTTGFDYNSELNNKLIENNLKWIYAHNFAPGMTIIQGLLKQLSKASKILGNMQTSITEIHHTKKIDAPSGTALKWQQWLDSNDEIESVRLGDEIGTHSVVIGNEFESIELTHKAKDRAIFAKGALLACDYILNDSNLTSGVHSFEEYCLNKLNK